MSNNQEYEDSVLGSVITSGYIKLAIEFYMVIFLSANSFLVSFLLFALSISATFYLTLQSLKLKNSFAYLLTFYLFTPLMSLLFLNFYQGSMLCLLISLAAFIIAYKDKLNKLESALYRLKQV